MQMHLQKTPEFAVHLCQESSEAQMWDFARPAAAGDLKAREAKLRLNRASHGSTGVPLLGGMLARTICKTVQRQIVGDHLMLIGEMLTVELDDEDGPLLHGAPFEREPRCPAPACLF
jgi:flavin reductase (DIM6/NTAB) family NADH-FMN oxidoreductase RutF